MSYTPQPRKGINIAPMTSEHDCESSTSIALATSLGPIEPGSALSPDALSAASGIVIGRTDEVRSARGIAARQVEMLLAPGSHLRLAIAQSFGFLLSLSSDFLDEALTDITKLDQSTAQFLLALRGIRNNPTAWLDTLHTLAKQIVVETEPDRKI